MFLFETGLFELMFSLIFFLIVTAFIVMLARGLLEWNRNNHSPVLSVQARVVSKRTKVSIQHHGDQGGNTSTTSYYATFQVESGDRLELRLSGREYGLLAEGDKGKLTFQRTRYRGFERRLE